MVRFSETEKVQHFIDDLRIVADVLEKHVRRHKDVGLNEAKFFAHDYAKQNSAHVRIGCPRQVVAEFEGEQ